MVTKIACPRCGVALSTARTKSVEMFGCGGCGGVWLDNGATRRVIDVLCDDTVHRAEALSRFSERTLDRAPGLQCPSCTKPLARWAVPEANIDVDWCEEHGTWFDKDELAAVSRTYAARRAYGGNAARVAVAGAAAGGVVAAGVVAADPALRDRVANAVGDQTETVLEVGSTALEFVDPVDVAEGAGVVLEGAGSVFGVLGDILGAIDF